MSNNDRKDYGVGKNEHILVQYKLEKSDEYGCNPIYSYHVIHRGVQQKKVYLRPHDAKSYCDENGLVLQKYNDWFE